MFVCFHLVADSWGRKVVDAESGKERARRVESNGRYFQIKAESQGPYYVHFPLYFEKQIRIKGRSGKRERGV